jgi:selenium metabolism protein YedF
LSISDSIGQAISARGHLKHLFVLAAKETIDYQSWQIIEQNITEELKMPVDNNLLLLLKSNMLGEGEPDLGEKLLKAWLEQLRESGLIPAKVICLNSGIFLTTEGSPVIDLLKKFEQKAAKIYSCGTCLNYYGRTEKLIIGEPTNMKDTVSNMLAFKKILSP